jgi:transcriptional regulator with XRE-family HTH domain
MNWNRKTDKDILVELGRRLKEKRIIKRFKQKELAQRAGITVYTLQKMEYGQSYTISTLLQVLRALNGLDGLENFIPENEISPMTLLKTKAKTIQRVRNPK